MKAARSTMIALTAALSACATPQMHSEAQLNVAATGCGLALGELIQDESEKRLLIMLRPGATPQQKACVDRWARQNHLKAVVIDQIQFPES